MENESMRRNLVSNLLFLFLLHASLSAEEITLYSYWGSSCSWRVRIALHWKEIPYEYAISDPLILSGEYQKLNPLDKIPTLCIDGFALSQSTSIIEYLEEQYPERPLLPSHPEARAKVREIVQLIASDIQPLQNGAVLKVLPHEIADEWAIHWIEKGLSGLEKLLFKTAGSCCFGDRITMADLYLLPQVWSARRHGVEISRYPTIFRIEQHLASHPSFATTHPLLQPDAP